MDDTINFLLINVNRVLQPHMDALILTLGISGFDMRRVLIDPSSSVDLLQMVVYRELGLLPSALENPGQILSGFNGAMTTSLGDIVLPIQVSPITQNVQFLVVKNLFPFNAIIGRMWLHSMKVIPFTYHQMVSYLTKDGQIDLFGSQLVAR